MHIQVLFENFLVRVERFFSIRNVFLFGSIGAAVVLTTLFYFGVLPLSVEYLLFYSLIIFLACLARPSWMFLLFVALLPLEIVTVTPPSLGFDLRPYQWVGGLLGLALGIRFITGRLARPLFHWHPVDIMLVTLVVGVTLSGFYSQQSAISKQILVVGSFLFLYFLARLFLRSWQDAKSALPFFLASASLGLLWGIGQNLLFFAGQGEFSIMPGRPNGTLIEPDWLGFFSLFLLAPTLFWFKERSQKGFSVKELVFPSFSLLLIFTVLIITVSRSAWLGALVLTGSFFFLAFYEKGKGFAFRSAGMFLQGLIVLFGLALVLVEVVPLTRFALIDRAASTASHDQTITIACDEQQDALPDSVSTAEDLARFGCRHINLEEVQAFEAEHKWVTTIKRPDPNVGIRKSIYETSWNEIQAHPILGIGWGNIGPKLGIDERGASYNASNLFLELWLGGGLLALLSFLILLVWNFRASYRGWMRDTLPEFFAPMIALLLGFLVFNLFNTGFLLGFVWVWFAFFPLLFPLMTNKS